MKPKLTIAFLLLFLFPLISSVKTSLLPTSNPLANDILLSNADGGIFNFIISQNVTYHVEMNFTLIHTGTADQDYYFKVARLDDRQPNSILTPYCPPYQKLESFESSITGWDVIEEEKIDKFNNTYDKFNSTLSTSEEITVNYRYNITLNDIYFTDIEDDDIGTYNPNDEIHALYNVTEQFYECDNPELIARSNNIVGSITNPVDKAEAIFNWIATNIVYEEQDEEIGAYEAYIHGKGDSSDISDLMITLLRIQSIPARKVTGFLISNKPSHRPLVGNKYSFDLSYTGATNQTSYTNRILAHSWIEYFIPSIGWIACDPTWKKGYFNGIDFLRFNLNVGAWFFLPGATPSDNYISEFPIRPLPICSDHTAYDFQYSIVVTVLETNLRTPYGQSIFYIIFTTIGLFAITTLLFLLQRRRAKKSIPYYKK